MWGGVGRGGMGPAGWDEMGSSNLHKQQIRPIMLQRKLRRIIIASHLVDQDRG